MRKERGRNIVLSQSCNGVKSLTNEQEFHGIPCGFIKKEHGNPNAKIRFSRRVFN